MDEILIEDKRYISSKRAAKITGYAKDYVGQLCREGRVPARLVGRSWYVLESAIHDHRFGNQEFVTEHTAPEKTWESPRYEAVRAETLPSVNRLKETVTPLRNIEASQHLQDSWKAWFDRVSVPTSEVGTPTESVGDEGETPVLEEQADEEEIAIPIRTVYNLPPEDLLPPRHIVHHLEEKPPSDGEEVYIQKRRREDRGVMRGLQIGGAVLAVFLAILAIIGTGYFDEYIISEGQDNIIAGVIMYNK